MTVADRTFETAERLRTVIDVHHPTEEDLARVERALGQAAAELIACKRSGLASDSRRADRVAGMAGDLETLLGEIEQMMPMDPSKRKMRFGSPSHGTTGGDLRARERLHTRESVADWCRANGAADDGALETGVDADQAWGAWFRGYADGDWREWRGMTRAMETGTGADGGFLVPTILSSRVIDLMRAATPIFAAGAVTVPMTSKTLDIARVGSDVDATAWHAENAAITPSQVGLEKVTFTAKTLPVLVQASRELAEDAPNTGEVIAQSIAGATAVEVTRAALRGDGTADSPVGVLNQTGVNTTAVAGAADWTTLANAVRDIAGRNDMANAYIAAPRTRTALELQTGSDGHFLAPPPSVAELDRYTTTVIPTDLGAGTDTELYVGRWSRLLIGMRVQMQIVPLRERYADNGQVAWISWLRLDIQLEHPESFQVLTGVSN